jgi:hypothetical protein
MIVCGDRNWSDVRYVWEVLERLHQNCHDDEFVVIEGQCPYGGADRHAADWALANRKNGVVHLPFPADWQRLGKAAGPIRNTRMLTEGRPDLVVAFHDALTKSRGTANMIEQAEKAGVEVWLIRHENSFD